jgi:hypothetical protein
MKRLAMSLTVIVLIIPGLMVITGSASAETLNTSPAGEIAWRGRLTIGEETPRTECNFRLAGTMARSVTMVRGNEMGRISSLAFEECRGEAIRTLEVIPLPVRFDSSLNSPERTLIGYLVTIESIGILFEIPRLLSGCLYSLTLAILTRVNRDGSTGSEVLLNLPLRLVRSLNGFLCPATLPIRGTATLTPTQTVTRT